MEAGLGKYTVLYYMTAKVWSWDPGNALVLVGLYIVCVPFYSDFLKFCIVWTINMSTESLRNRNALCFSITCTFLPCAVDRPQDYDAIRQFSRLCPCGVSNYIYTLSNCFIVLKRFVK